MKILLSLKEEFTKTIGKKWTPELIKQCPTTTTTTSSPTPSNGASTTPSNGASTTPNGQDLLVKIDLQGAKVRELKSAKASKVCFILYK